jgi:acetyl esterase/lipase
LRYEERGMVSMLNITRRNCGILEALAIAVATTLGTAVFAQTPARPAADSGVNVHPDLRQAAGGRGFPAATPLPGGPAAVQRTVPGPKGAPDVKVTVVNGGGGAATPRPAILHIHGGGYTGGSAAIMIPSLQALAAALDCVMVSVDYRLAPGTKFPGSLEDNYAMALWERP